jgi:hypothetical protein
MGLMANLLSLQTFRAFAPLIKPMRRAWSKLLLAGRAQEFPHTDLYA